MISAVAERKATPVAAAGRFALAESPRWHHGWWWVDVPAGTVLSCDPTSWQVHRWELRADRVSFVLPYSWPGRDAALPAGGGMIAARGTELVLVPRNPGDAPTMLGRVTVPAGWVLNDAVVGARGCLWVGLVDPVGTPGALVRVDATGAVLERVEGFTMSNGLSWTVDGSLLHVDSGTGTVWCHLRRTDGSLATISVLTIPRDVGVPDGICADRAGGFWLAIYGAGQVRHYTQDGRLDQIVTLPTPQATSVALGGADGRDLLITTGREGFTAAMNAADQWAGMIFLARTDGEGG